MNFDNHYLQRYFDREAARFDEIYEARKPVAHRIVDALFRRVIVRRMSLILDACGDVRGRTILDIGCGSGRFSRALAERGGRVLGVDLSRRMLSIAAGHRSSAPAGTASYIQGEFMEMAFTRPFDISLSVGVMDYIPEPGQMVEKILSVTRGTAIFSFPRRYGLRALVRKIRLGIRGCPLRFYSRQEINALFRAPGASGRLEMITLSRDYIVFFHISPRGGQ